MVLTTGFRGVSVRSVLSAILAMPPRQKTIPISSLWCSVQYWPLPALFAVSVSFLHTNQYYVCQPRSGSTCILADLDGEDLSLAESLLSTGDSPHDKKSSLINKIPIPVLVTPHSSQTYAIKAAPQLVLPAVQPTDNRQQFGQFYHLP